MGGYGSGRPSSSRKPTAESMKRLDLARLRRDGSLRSGTASTISWSCGGESTGSIGTIARADALRLMYRVGSRDTGPGTTSTRRCGWPGRRPTSAGERVWFSARAVPGAAGCSLAAPAFAVGDATGSLRLAGRDEGPIGRSGGCGRSSSGSIRRPSSMTSRQSPRACTGRPTGGWRTGTTPTTSNGAGRRCVGSGSTLSNAHELLPDRPAF